MSDYIFVNYELTSNETLGFSSPIKIGNGIVIQNGTSITRNNENELNLTGGAYLVNYSVSSFNNAPSVPRIEVVIEFRGTPLMTTYGIGPQANGIALASNTAILQAEFGINNIVRIVNHSDNPLTEGTRTNLTIFKLP